MSCGILETPRFGRKSNFLFTPGAVVTFECNEGFFLNGDRRRVCQNTGRWDTPQYGYTECLRKSCISFLLQSGLDFRFKFRTNNFPMNPYLFYNSCKSFSFTNIPMVICLSLHSLSFTSFVYKNEHL